LAVDSVDLAVSNGETVGLIGPNGAGKTTLFNLLAGSLTPDEGTIEFKSRDVTKWSPERRCDGGLTRTFQIPRPFTNLSVVQNVTVGGLAHRCGRREAESRAQKALELVGLWHRRTDPALSLPLGQLKRLELARCLSTRPDLVLLDEIAGGLTASEVVDIVEVVTVLADSGLTIIIIEHNINLIVSVCSRVIALNQGRVLADGTHQEVTSNPEVIRAYLGEPIEYA
jgi:branched-chain amino acid transport system ATP-binding protein